MLWTNNGITAHKLEGLTTGIEPEKKQNNFSVSPNPASEYVRITNVENIKRIELYSIAGNLVLQVLPIEQLNISSLIPGIYMIKILSKNGTSEVYKLLKNK